MDVKVQIVEFRRFLLISPTAEYALRAIVAIAQGGGNAVVTATLVEMTKVPAGYLPKVLQTLRRAGLVQSKRGLGGAYAHAVNQ